jgi:hypothetical protein
VRAAVSARAATLTFPAPSWRALIDIVRHEILTRQFIGDFSINARQFASLLQEERRSSSLLSEMTQHEVAFDVTT